MKLHGSFHACSVATLVLLAATAAFAQSGVRINEVLAQNVSLAQNGIISDWAELYNPGPGAVDLSDYSLTDTLGSPRKFVFQPGTSIPAGGYLVVRWNPNAAASAGNTGSGLAANGGALYLLSSLVDGGRLLDSVQWGIQTADYAIGRVPNGSGAWRLTVPTYAAANTPAAMGAASALKINEWMADPRGTADDYFEIYNSGSQPVDLSGLYLTDSPGVWQRFQIAALSFIGVGPANGYLKMVADSDATAGADHVNFALSADGEALVLCNTNLTVIDGVSFGPQQEGASEGRLPDGSTNIVRFTFTPTPGAPNRLLYPLTNVVINELLSHTDPPLEDAIELCNVTDAPVNIGGWYLSDVESDLRRYRIPTGTIIPARGYKVFYEYQFNYGNTLKPFNFNSAHGGEVFLAQADAVGNLTAFARQAFGASANGVSFGRHVKSDGVDFVAMSRRSFGQDAPLSVSQFRTGTGRVNPYPLVGPVVINEVMYHPPDIDGLDNTLDEYIELRNITTASVPLYDPQFPTNHWQLSNAVFFVFPAGIVMRASEYLLVVNFDPKANAAQLAAFRTKFSVPAGVRIFGPYEGKLDNNGESLELYKPDPVQRPPHPDAGWVPPVLVDKVKYKDQAPWPAGTDGTGNSLQRIGSAKYGDDPLNWKADAPTPGGINGFPPVITSQPQGQWVYAGDTVTLGVAATGTLPMSFQWRLNGTNLPKATNVSLTLTNIRAANAGSYTVSLKNLAGSATSAVAAIKGDFVRPTVSITSPVSGARITNDVAVVRGRAGDPQGVAQVLVRANGGEFQPAQGSTNWSAQVNLLAGANTIQVKAIDFGRNESTQATARVVCVVLSPLALTVTEGGSVTGVTNGQLLEVGKAYTATAKPKVQYLFAGWTGGLVSSNASLRFGMQSNLVLQANFLRNPFLPIKGVYNGLFSTAATGVTPTNAGFCRMTLTETGSFSGQLRLGTATNSFAGRFGLDLRGWTQIARSGRSALALDLTLDPAGEVRGTITDGSWVADLEAPLTGVAPEVAGYAGRYTWVMPGADDPDSSPGGDGAGAAVAGTNGTVQLTGTLGDGTAISHSAGLSRYGELPVSIPLHSGRGLLFGWMNFSTNTLMSNLVAWIKPVIATNQLYPDGFAGLKVLYGSKYNPPASGQTLLNWTNGLVCIGAGNLAPPLTNRVQLNSNTVRALDGNGNRLSLTLALTNGLFTGSFQHPVTLKTNTFKGAILQGPGWGGGWFRGTNQTGYISLDPEPGP